MYSFITDIVRKCLQAGHPRNETATIEVLPVGMNTLIRIHYPDLPIPIPIGIFIWKTNNKQDGTVFFSH
jgi:hypothetical protein